MSLTAYLWGLKISTFLALIAWGLTVYFVDPEKGGFVGKFLFYCSFFLTVVGVFTLVFTWTRKRKMEESGQAFHIGMSLRQGLLVALLATILLVMQHFRVLVWWDGLLVVAGILLIELYFLSR